MPECHRCHREFTTTTNLTHHFQQPDSTCHRIHSFNERITIAEALRQNQHLNRSQQLAIPRSPSPSPRPPSPPTRSPSPLPPPEQIVNDNREQDVPPPPRFHIKKHPGAGTASSSDQNFMNRFDDDWFAEERKHNIYYPFASKEEWDVAFFLVRSRLSSAFIDEFLALPLIHSLRLSFRSAKTLRSWVEMLPPGPQWDCRPMRLHPNYPTKKPVALYYRDPVECIESLMQNPLICDHLSYTPIQVYRSAANLMRVYSHWLTGTHAWELQDAIPNDSTLLGIVLSSDKTQLTAMTGGRSAYPLLISLANLDFDFRNKASNNAFLLLALLPIPKFVEARTELHGVLISRLIHRAFDIAVKPLKIAAEIGIMLSDAFGRSRYCFTPLVADIVDYPEAQLMACVSGGTSPVTLAIQKEFGDSTRHPPRTRDHTLDQLRKLALETDPWDLWSYVKDAKSARLSGVHKPFWRDWALSDPSKFLTPEPLHHWFKAFYDHDLKWGINGVGSTEFDFRYSTIPIHQGYRRFPEGVSKLKQVTGREHREILRYFVPVIAGAVPSKFLLALRSLADFRYRAQAPELDDADLQKIEASLKTFHNNKQAIIDARARLGKKNKVIDKWEIPKLEMLQSVVPSFRASGCAAQWSADTTEHKHVKLVKQPAKLGNNQGLESQICRNLDLQDKCCVFDLSTSIRSLGLKLGRASGGGDGGDETSDEEDDEEGDNGGRIYKTQELIDATAHARYTGRKSRNKDYFAHAEAIREDVDISQPYHTSSIGSTSVHLKNNPCHPLTSIDEVATLFGIQDLRSALSRYVQRASNNEAGVFIIGGPRSRQLQPLPFDLRVWTRCRIQNRSFHYPHSVLPASTVHAAPPDDLWKKGRMDAVILNTTASKHWPQDRLDGHCVAELCLIMEAIPHAGAELPTGLEAFVVYARRFDIVPQVNPEVSQTTVRGPYPEPDTSLYVLRRALGSGGVPTGDIVPLIQLRASVNLIPRFGPKADVRVTRETSLAYYSDFYLNKYFTKELFYAFS
ncbi:hypothetical protein BDN72DRAFT_896229 [Pluteus cervinus]|uniref:Uncharacterized protein n=1 Tax=Pluteus cervinus TaxID=181527 RepID=A0ACD3AZ63_9AGAR|nr:hypothetical protein BDN72DRAFT_896229 [Pluteus cervinus]